MKRYIHYLAIFLVVVPAVLWSVLVGRKPRPAGDGTIRARVSDLKIAVSGPGRMRARDTVLVKAPTGFWGQRQLLYLIPEGTNVLSGDVVALLDTTQVAADLEDDRGRLADAAEAYEQLLSDHANTMGALQNGVQAAKLARQQAVLRLQNLDFASELERQQARLDVEKSEISRNEALRRIEAQVKIDEAEEDQSRIRLDGRQREVDEDLKELDSMTVRAPRDGIVVHGQVGRRSDRRNIIEGDMVRGRQTLLEIPDLSVMQMIVELNELDAADIRIGLEAEVIPEAFPELTLRGRVVERSMLMVEKSDQSNVRIVPVIVEVGRVDDRIRPGMTAHADITVNTLRDVLMVPMEAVQLIDGDPYVLPAGTPDPIRVTLGRRNALFVQITSPLSGDIDLRLRWVPGGVSILDALAGGLPIPPSSRVQDR